MARRHASFYSSPDAAEAIVAAAQSYDGADPVNIGSGDEISIRDLANKLRC